MIDKTQSGSKRGRLRHRFRTSPFLSVQTKTQPRSYKTKTGCVFWMFSFHQSERRQVMGVFIFINDDFTVIIYTLLLHPNDPNITSNNHAVVVFAEENFQASQSCYLT